MTKLPVVLDSEGYYSGKCFSLVSLFMMYFKILELVYTDLLREWARDQWSYQF